MAGGKRLVFLFMDSLWLGSRRALPGEASSIVSKVRREWDPLLLTQAWLLPSLPVLPAVGNSTDQHSHRELGHQESSKDVEKSEIHVRRGPVGSQKCNLEGDEP